MPIQGERGIESGAGSRLQAKSANILGFRRTNYGFEDGRGGAHAQKVRMCPHGLYLGRSIRQHLHRAHRSDAILVPRRPDRYTGCLQSG